ncbi:ATPase inhibitor subunit zeta [Rhizobium sp. FKL33]|uniref:ATPase inhibitor subunit zeta n=1 Tax=Rhizobium sp. FKL33 TaxID=2562307 RepID=UPI0014852E15|nr:ATPase inhibitor subunit zeta [Rhizobium sp. FKL33]
MNNLKKLESTLENKFAHDEDVRFRAIMRRTRRLAAWASEQTGADSDAYASELANLYLTTPDDDVMAGKVRLDLNRAGIACAHYEVRVKMVELLFAEQQAIAA